VLITVPYAGQAGGGGGVGGPGGGGGGGAGTLGVTEFDEAEAFDGMPLDATPITVNV